MEVTSAIIKSANKNIQKTKNQSKYPSCYWWTEECTEAKRAKNRALTKYKNHLGDLSLWNQYKETKRNFCLLYTSDAADE